MKKGMMTSILAVVLVAAVGLFVLVKGVSVTGMVEASQQPENVNKYISCVKECRAAVPDCLQIATGRYGALQCRETHLNCERDCVETYLPPGHR